VGGVEQALVVDGNHPVPLIGVAVDDRTQQHESGVVDQGVQAAEPVDGLGDGGLCLGAVGDVGLDRERRATGLLDLRSQVLQSVLAPGDERHRSTVIG
jgi:hypothetical protein